MMYELQVFEPTQNEILAANKAVEIACKHGYACLDNGIKISDLSEPNKYTLTQGGYEEGLKRHIGLKHVKLWGNDGNPHSAFKIVFPDQSPVYFVCSTGEFVREVPVE